MVIMNSPQTLQQSLHKNWIQSNEADLTINIVAGEKEPNSKLFLKLSPQWKPQFDSLTKENIEEYVYKKQNSYSKMSPRQKMSPRHRGVDTLVTFQPGPMGIQYKGNYIKSIAPDSQAEKLGVCIGWQMIAINGESQPNDGNIIDAAINKTYIHGKPTHILFCTNNIFQKSKHNIPFFSLNDSKSLKKNLKKMPVLSKKQNYITKMSPRHKGVDALVTFQTGKMGIRFQGNRIISVSPGTQGENLGVCVGWQIISVNGEMQPNDGDAINAAIDKTYEHGNSTHILFCTNNIFQKDKSKLSCLPSKNSDPVIAVNKKLATMFSTPLKTTSKYDNFKEKEWQIISINDEIYPDDENTIDIGIDKTYQLGKLSQLLLLLLVFLMFFFFFTQKLFLLVSL